MSEQWIKLLMTFYDENRPLITQGFFKVDILEDAVNVLVPKCSVCKYWLSRNSLIRLSIL